MVRKNGGGVGNVRVGSVPRGGGCNVRRWSGGEKEKEEAARREGREERRKEEGEGEKICAVFEHF